MLEPDPSASSLHFIGHRGLAPLLLKLIVMAIIVRVFMPVYLIWRGPTNKIDSADTHWSFDLAIVVVLNYLHSEFILKINKKLK